ncbi:MAG TPA: alpha/beta hydrolase [Ramlibacter sp.]|nr:alpha/beta hydrolase [Ramlibacter sp.]
MQEAGSGSRTLILLPGTLGTVDIFHRQLAAFSGSCRVLVLGYPGVSSAEAMTASFLQLLEQLGVRSAHFAGSSLGAYWLHVFLREQPRLARSVLLANTFLDPARLRFIRMFDPAYLDSVTPTQLKEAWLAFARELPQAELREFLVDAVGNEQSAEELAGRCRTIATAGRVEPLDLPPGLVRILSCADDRVIAPDTAQEVAAAYPGAQHVRLATGGHYPHLLSATEYNRLIEANLLDHP